MENGNEIKFVDLQIEEKDKHVLIPEDSIILLLYARRERAIMGRTVMQKELFLMYNEILTKKEFAELRRVDPNFVPYKFGPFSFKMSSALASLIFRGKVAKSGVKNWEKFYITEDGKHLAIELMSTFPNELVSNLLETLYTKRKGWDQLGRRGLIIRTKMLFPQYYEFSIIGDRYSNALRALGASEKEFNEPSVVIHKMTREIPAVENYNKLIEENCQRMDKKFGGEAWGKLYVELR